MKLFKKLFNKKKRPPSPIYLLRKKYFVFVGAKLSKAEIVHNRLVYQELHYTLYQHEIMAIFNRFIKEVGIKHETIILPLDIKQLQAENVNNIFAHYEYAELQKYGENLTYENVKQIVEKWSRVSNSWDMVLGINR